MKIALLWLCIIAIFVIGLVTRFSNPDLTETRLFIEFWPRYVVIFILGLLAVWLLRRSE